METLRACPKARYEDGLDTAKSDVLADVLRQIGCTQAAEILTNPDAEAQAKQRIAEGANLARQFGVSGVPFTVRQTESGWAQMA
ncbi:MULTISPECIES: metal ABC transporter substrate-binding protein [unclassified Eikenella]|uniref:metal ABC transporter substrate-binding protein n=1 Tax=unclassified Eikenella TaxID=2639367 RepID=UPI0008A4443A|nr:MULTISPECIES: metal ABC transporter substrate-binding protein [unclassified Eikenella]OFK90125.1 metal ABC transporter substrate-binding protein [Eikenella sp. HMSC071B05]OFO46205.1 metal ABC transporter substrate-binding protein [Eikenella sp. HMSC073A11]